MRISDWSSDVCSSDLIARHVGPAEWDKPEMVTFLGRHLAQPSGVLRSGDSMKRATAQTIRAFASLKPSPALPLAIDEGIPLCPRHDSLDPPKRPSRTICTNRKRCEEGKSVTVRVDLGGRRNVKKKK